LLLVDALSIIKVQSNSTEMTAIACNTSHVDVYLKS